MKNLVKILIFSLLAITAYAQQSTEIDSKSVKLPRYVDQLAVTNALPSPTQGMMIYRTDTKSNWYYDGFAWKDMAVSSVSVPSPLYLTSTGTTIAGETNQADEAGVLGINTTDGVSYGVLGRASHIESLDGGAGVKGENMSTNGLGYGVMGIHNGTGWAGYFQGTNALKTDGALQFSVAGTAAKGKQLTAMDASGNAQWSDLIPRLSTESIDALPSPQLGDLAYDLTFKCMKHFNGTNWQCVYDNPADPQPQITAWKIGGTGEQKAESIICDNTGNVIVTGEIRGNCDFGGIIINATTNTYNAGVFSPYVNLYDLFIAKYNKDGGVIWAKKINNGSGTSNSNNASSKKILNDGSGNLFIVGRFYNNLTFEAGTPSAITLSSAGGSDIFIAKYDPNGNFIWAKKSGGTGDDEAGDLELDSNGDLFISGTFNGTATFGTSPVTTNITSNGGSDIYIAKFNNAGTLAWVQKGGGATNDFGKGLAVSSAGKVYVTGSIRGSATFGSLTANGNSSNDNIFFGAFNPITSNWEFAEKAGGSSGYSTGIDVSVGNSIRLIGTFSGNATFGNGISYAIKNITNTGTSYFDAFYVDNGDVFLLDYSVSNSFPYSSEIKAKSNSINYSIGYFSGRMDYKYDVLSTNGSYDIFLNKTTDINTNKMIKIGGSNSNDYGKSIAYSPDGNIYLTGHFTGTSQFGNTTLTASGSNDAFIIRIKE